jgi:hypothetical protein
LLRIRENADLTEFSPRKMKFLELIPDN